MCWESRQFTLDGRRSGRRLGDRLGDSPGTEIRQSRNLCRNLWLQRGARGYRHILLLQAGRDQHRPAGCGLRCRDARDVVWRGGTFPFPPTPARSSSRPGGFTFWVWRWASRLSIRAPRLRRRVLRPRWHMGSVRSCSRRVSGRLFASSSVSQSRTGTTPCGWLPARYWECSLAFTITTRRTRSRRLGFTATTRHSPPSRSISGGVALIPPLLGILICVPITELFPKLGLPALTAPFVLATWLVLSLGWLESKLFASRVSPAA